MPGQYNRIVKIWGVPSRSEKGTIRRVELLLDGSMVCNCPARKTTGCWHIKHIKEKVILKEYAKLLEEKRLKEFSEQHLQ